MGCYMYTYLYQGVLFLAKVSSGPNSVLVNFKFYSTMVCVVQISRGWVSRFYISTRDITIEDNFINGASILFFTPSSYIIINIYVGCFLKLNTSAYIRRCVEFRLDCLIRTTAPQIDSDRSDVIATCTGLGTALCFFSKLIVSKVVLVPDHVKINCIEVKRASSLVDPHPTLRPQLLALCISLSTFSIIIS